MLANELRESLGRALGDAYTLERELGAGGMATVFLARDVKHKREVALKVLHSWLGIGIGRDRFLREIELTARLQHPHILPVFDSGTSDDYLWYTMPYIEGETLRMRLTRTGRLSLSEATAIARDVGAALSYAHERGVVHRDIKPENILLTVQGDALVADFGIAKALESADNNLTATGLGVGTLSYMSPEQMMGERPVQPQTDVYALGVVVHEMLAGARPFVDGAPAVMLARRLAEGAPSVTSFRPDVPSAVAALVQRSLEVDPARRPATGTIFVALLDDAARYARPAATSLPAPVRRTLRRSVATAIPIILVLAALAVAYALSRSGGKQGASIAVLPFSNRTGDTAQSYLSDGLAEDLTARLARIEQLRVAPNSSTLRFRSSGEAPEVFAKALAVNHVLTGVLSRRGDSVRVSVELIDVITRTQRWSEARTVPQRELAMLVDSMARAVAAKLLPNTRLADDSRSPVTRDSLAYTYYLLGLHHYNQFSPIGLERSMAYYDSVIARDPAFVGAWIGRASVLMAMASGNGLMTGRDALLPLRAALDTILVLEPRSGVAHGLRGHSYTWFEWDFEAAGRELKQALALAPREPTVFVRASFLQVAEGRTDSALALLTVARQLDPTNIRPVNATAVANFYGRRYEECLTWVQRALVLAPDFPPAVQYQALCLSALGRRAEAVRVSRRAVETIRQPLMLSTLAIVLAQSDSVEAARLLIVELLALGARAPLDRGLVFRIYAALNDRARFFASLEQAIGDRSYQVSYLPLDPVLDPVRADPRFAQMLARAGLPLQTSRAPTR